MTVITFALAAMLAAAGPPAATPSTASQPAIPGLDGETRKVVDRALQQYETLRSYEDAAVSSLEAEFEGKAPGEAPEPTTMPLVYTWPNRINFRTSLYHIVSDGKILREAMDIWLQYSQSDAPKTLSLDSLALKKFPFFQDTAHPLMHLLLAPGKPSLDFLGTITRYEQIRTEPLSGRAGKRVIGTVQPPGNGGQAVLELWFDDKTGLIGEILIDQTKAAQSYYAVRGFKAKKYLQRFRFNELRMNEPIADAKFALINEPNLDKVDVLRLPAIEELQQRLVGRPAFEFTGTDLDGKELRSADLKGRVVLLDFWSLGCGPCIMSMPTIQRIADKFANKPVSVIGINLDGSDAADRIAAKLKERQVKFRQIVKIRPDLSGKYFVKAIPFAVLVDGKGIIQEVHTGMAEERELTERITKLLKGENLYVKK